MGQSKKIHHSDSRKYALPADNETISDEELRRCLKEAENSPTLSLEEFKRRWKSRLNQSTE